MAGFLDVLLRGLGVWGQALATGGVLFGVLVLWPATREVPSLGLLVRSTLQLIAVARPP